MYGIQKGLSAIIIQDDEEVTISEFGFYLQRRIIMALAVAVSFGFEKFKKITISILIGFIIAASSISLKIGLLPETLNRSLLLAAILTGTTSPRPFNKIYRDNVQPIKVQRIEEFSAAIGKEH